MISGYKNNGVDTCFIKKLSCFYDRLADIFPGQLEKRFYFIMKIKCMENICNKEKDPSFYVEDYKEILCLLSDKTLSNKKHNNIYQFTTSRYTELKRKKRPIELLFFNAINQHSKLIKQNSNKKTCSPKFFLNKNAMLLDSKFKAELKKIALFYEPMFRDYLK
jgi:hypothetical protein